MILVRLRRRVRYPETERVEGEKLTLAVTAWRELAVSP